MILTVFYHSLPTPQGSSGQGGSVGTTFERETFVSFSVTLFIYYHIYLTNRKKTPTWVTIKLCAGFSEELGDSDNGPSAEACSCDPS